MLWRRDSLVEMPAEEEVNAIDQMGSVIMMGVDMGRFVPEMEAGIARMRAALQTLDEGAQLNADAASKAMWAAGLIALGFGLDMVASWLA